MGKATTPWGQAEVVEEFTVQQRAGERRFATIVQLLVDEKGNELVRFAYSTDGTARRGPVTLRGRDLEASARRWSNTPLSEERSVWPPRPSHRAALERHPRATRARARRPRARAGDRQRARGGA